jgi:hypothetical protein
MSLGCGSLLLVAKAMYIGVYDILGLQVVVTFVSLLTLNPIVIFFGYSVLHLVEMVVVSVNNMEDVGGHVWLRVLVVSGIFSQNHLLGHVVLLFGQVKHTYHTV